MKRISFLFYLSVISLSVSAQEIATPYSYPIKPGSAEWKKFKSGDEMAIACNIPDLVLKNLNTRALVTTCLDYPLFNEVLAANNLQAGFSSLVGVFNGFRELLNRKDAGKELLMAYQTLNPQNLPLLQNLVERGDFTFKFTYIELLLSQTQITYNLSGEEKRLLRQEALKKFEQKKVLINDFGAFGLNTSAWVLGKLLQFGRNTKCPPKSN